MARRGNDINVFDVQAALREQAAGPAGHNAYEIPSGSKVHGKSYPTLYRNLSIIHTPDGRKGSYLNSVIPLENASYVNVGTGYPNDSKTSSMVSHWAPVINGNFTDDPKGNKTFGIHGTIPKHSVIGRSYPLKMLKEGDHPYEHDTLWPTSDEEFHEQMSKWQALPSVGFYSQDGDTRLMTPEELRDFPRSLTHSPGQGLEEPPFNPSTGSHKLIHVIHSLYATSGTPIRDSIKKHYAYEPQSERLTRLHHDDLEEMFKNS